MMISFIVLNLSANLYFSIKYYNKKSVLSCVFLSITLIVRATLNSMSPPQPRIILAFHSASMRVSKCLQGEDPRWEGMMGLGGLGMGSRASFLLQDFNQEDLNVGSLALSGSITNNAPLSLVSTLVCLQIIYFLPSLSSLAPIMNKTFSNGPS